MDGWIDARKEERKRKEGRRKSEGGNRIQWRRCSPTAFDLVSM